MELAQLPLLPEARQRPPRTDWLIDPAPFRAGAYCGESEHELVLDNGLIGRAWRLRPNGATVAYANRMTGESVIRSVRPEAVVELNGETFAVGGLVGLEEHAYLRREWVDGLESDPQAFQLAGWETGPTQAPFAWKQVRHVPDLPWPPPGVRLTLTYRPPEGKLDGVEVRVCCELYDGIPLICKWLTVRNRTGRAVRLNSFVAEILAAVEYESTVDAQQQYSHSKSPG